MGFDSRTLLAPSIPFRSHRVSCDAHFALQTADLFTSALRGHARSCRPTNDTNYSCLSPASSSHAVRLHAGLNASPPHRMSDARVSFARRLSRSPLVADPRGPPSPRILRSSAAISFCTNRCGVVISIVTLAIDQRMQVWPWLRQSQHYRRTSRPLHIPSPAAPLPTAAPWPGTLPHCPPPRHRHG